jgi:CBS domain-containing protein
MTAPARVLTSKDTLNCVAQLMRDAALGCIPIVAENGHVVGILTDRDVALAAYEHGEALWRLPIADAMHRPVFTCHPDDDVQVAASLMHEHRVRRLPVVDAAHRVVGILSLDDLAHAAHAPAIERAPGLGDEQLGRVYDVTSGRSKHEPESG